LGGGRVLPSRRRTGPTGTETETGGGGSGAAGGTGDGGVGWVIVEWNLGGVGILVAESIRSIRSIRLVASSRRGTLRGGRPTGRARSCRH
jgi:hypothetical protein